MKRKRDSSIPRIDSTGVRPIWHGRPFQKTGGFNTHWRNGSGVSAKNEREMAEIRRREQQREVLYMAFVPSVVHEISALPERLQRRFA